MEEMALGLRAREAVLENPVHRDVFDKTPRRTQPTKENDFDEMFSGWKAHL